VSILFGKSSRCIYWLIKEAVGIGLYPGTINQEDRFSPKQLVKVFCLFPEEEEEEEEEEGGGGGGGDGGGGEEEEKE
jgi:hypothetical protein